jgi:putative transposase
MPRMNRIQSPGSFFHIMARGIDGRNLFYDEEDHYEFLNRFRKYLIKSGFRCFSWNLMDNHYHLVIQTNENRLDSLFGPLNGGYALWYNKKYKRHGYLFQYRFKSVLCQDSHHLSDLIRYIHLNPLRANIIQSYDQLTDWKWSSHNLLIGAPNAIGADFVDKEAVLGRFNQHVGDALNSYNQYMQDGIDNSNMSTSGQLPKTEQTELAGAHKGRVAVIGDPEFVRKAMENHSIGLYRLHRKDDYHYVLKRIASEACNIFKLTLEDLRRRGRRNARSWARAYFCYKALTDELLPLTAIANFLAICLSPTAVLAKQGKIIAKSVVTTDTQIILV